MSVQPIMSEQYELTDLSEAIEFYFDKGWTDGLPVVPPTENGVRAFIEHSGILPSTVLGTVPTRGRVVTAEKVAINALMAGCLPEYMPVIIAATEAILDDAYNLHGCTASTGGSAVLMVINGPITKELNVNSGVNLFGPGVRANATIGRTMRLILMNVCGAIPGVLDKSTIGHPGKYSFCIAEAEDISPWEPLHVERGFSVSTSTVTVFPALGPYQIANRFSETPEGILSNFADAMKAIGPNQTETMLVLSPQHAQLIAQGGWSKVDVKGFLFERSKRTIKDWLDNCRIEEAEVTGELSEPLSVLREPDSTTVIVGGGEAGVFSSIVPMWAGGSGARSVSRIIKRP